MYRDHFGFHSTTPFLLFLAVFCTNVFWWKTPWLGLPLFLIFLVLLGLSLGRAAVPHQTLSQRLWIGVWLLLSGIMVAGTVTYYAHSFPASAALALALLTVPIAWCASRRTAAQHTSPPSSEGGDAAARGGHETRILIPALASVAALAFSLTFRLLTSSATFDAVASPWNVVPPAVFVAFGAGLLALAVLWFRGHNRAIILGLTTIALFVFLSVNVSVLPIGAGFDPFIHRATETHIIETGTITPKPLYYIGQYTLVAFLNHAFSLPVDFADRALLPLLTALLLPLAWIGAAEHLLPERRRALFTLIGAFLLPLGGFATTTPQGLANLWILLLILASVPLLMQEHRLRARAVLILPALAAVAIHPLAGLPALLYVAFLLCDPAVVSSARGQTVVRVLRGVLIALGAIMLPVSFFFLRHGPVAPVDFRSLPTQLLHLIPAIPALGFPFRPALDFSIGLAWAVGFILLGLAVLGWRVTVPRLRFVCVALAGALCVNYVLLATVVDFSFLIDYERMNYAERLLPLALFALAPLIIAGLGLMRERLAYAPRVVQAFAIVLCAAAPLGLWYSAYPRDDAYLKGHGYNVSAADFEAVHTIEADANGQPYLALANQSVSAAAISAIGFRYYGDQFFYPIPTGGDLYQTFLDMNATPDRAHIERVLAQYPAVHSVYFVLDAYWWDAQNIAAKTRAIADTELIIQGGKVRVYRFDREKGSGLGM